MCLPSNFLKTVVCISTLLTLCVGIVAVACSVTIGTNELFISSVKETKLIVMYSILVLGIILILLSFSGIFGVCKKSASCLTIYNIGLLVFVILFLGLGIGTLVAFQKYDIDLSDPVKCSEVEWLKDANDYVKQSEKYICHEKCGCGLTLEFVDKTGLNVTRNGVLRTQDCPGFAYEFNRFNEYFAAMELIERELSCAGLCEKSKYFLFSDINAGWKDMKGCAEEIQKYFLDYGKRVGAVSIVVGIFLGIVLIMSFCLCCHPDKKQEKNIYRRLI